jgi:hypothetical protein
MIFLYEVCHNFSEGLATKHCAAATSRKAGPLVIPSRLEERLTSMIPKTKTSEELGGPLWGWRFKFWDAFADDNPKRWVFQKDLLRSFEVGGLKYCIVVTKYHERTRTGSNSPESTINQP